jgi:hypothetical protein
MDPTYLQQKHAAGKPYAQYVATGTPQQQANWKRIYEQASLTDGQRRLVGSFVRRINVIGLSGVWCGDCVQQCPLIERIAEANPAGSGGKIDLRWIDRDEHIDLQRAVMINGGQRVPVLVFCAEDYQLVSWYGDRTLQRYRAIAQRQLGPSCPLPGAPVDPDEIAQTLQGWLDEFERVHLLLRLSGRLRQIYAD